MERVCFTGPDWIMLGSEFFPGGWFVIFIQELRAYPIKSLGGCFVDSLTVAEDGFQEDHQFVVVDREGNFINPRHRGHEVLMGAQIKMSDDVVIVTSPRVKRTLVVPLAGSAGAIMRVTVHGDVFDAEHQGKEGERWFSTLLGKPAMLVRTRNPRARLHRNPAVPGGPLPVNTADESPGHLLGNASLRELNLRLIKGGKERVVSTETFRPQVVLGGIAEPYYEDSFAELRLGGMLARISGQTLRCNVVDIDPQSGQRNSDGHVLKYLSHPRPTSPQGRPFFGVYFWWPSSEITKVIRVKEQVRILELKS